MLNLGHACANKRQSCNIFVLGHFKTGLLDQKNRVCRDHIQGISQESAVHLSQASSVVNYSGTLHVTMVLNDNVFMINLHIIVYS